MTVSMMFDRNGESINWDTKFTIAKQKEALDLWRDGFDTLDIAQELNIYEAVIYNNQPKWRGKP